MAIQFVGGTGAGRAGSTSTASQSLTALSGGIASAPAEGDLVIVVVATASQGRNPSCAISGWNTVGTQLNVTTQTYDVSLQVSYKFMGSTPDTSITIPSTGDAADGQSRRVLVFRGVDPTTPFDVSSVSATGTGTTRFNAAAIEPTTAGAWIVVMGGGAASASTTVLGTPSGLSGWAAYNGADTNDGSAGGGYYDGWTSGSYDPAAPTTGGSVNAANSWAAWTIALRPAPPPTVTVTPSSNTIEYGETADLSVDVSSGGSPVVGASVTASSSATADVIAMPVTTSVSVDVSTYNSLTELTYSTPGGTAPSGATIRRFTETTADSSHSISLWGRMTGAATGDSRYLRVEVRSTRNAIRLNLGGDGTGQVDLLLSTPATQTIGGTGTVATSRALGSDWYEVVLYNPSASGSSADFYINHTTESGGVFDDSYVGATDQYFEIGEIVGTRGASTGATTDSGGDATIRYFGVSAGSATITATCNGGTDTSEITVSSGLSGSLSKTLDAATLSSTGTVDLAGTLSTTLGSVTSVATGAVDLVGTLSSTLAAATAASTGALAVEGSLSSTLGDATLSAAGTLAEAGIEGELASTLADAAVSSAGTLAIEGQAAATLAASTATATGAVAIRGQAAAALASTTLAGTGALEIAGSAAATLADATSSATGALAITGSLSGGLGAAALPSIGLLFGSGGALAPATLEASGAIGNVPITGSLSATLAAASLDADGALEIAGTAAATLAAATAAATGTLALRGSVGATLADATVVAAGAVDILGTVAPTLADAALTASGAIALRGEAAATLDDASLSASGQGGEFIAGELAATLADATAAAAGRLAIDAQVAATLATATIAAAARLYAGAGRRGGVGGQKQSWGRPADSVVTRSAVQTVMRSGDAGATRRNVQQVSRVN